MRSCFAFALASRVDSTKAVSESAYVTRSRSCPRCVWVRASWSVGNSRRRHACADRPVRMSGGVLLLLPFLCRPHQARPAPRPVAARECPSRGLFEGLVTPPSCSVVAVATPRLHRAPPRSRRSSLYVVLHLAVISRARHRPSFLDDVIPTVLFRRCLSVSCPSRSGSCLRPVNGEIGVELGTRSLCNSRLLSSRQLDLAMNCFLNNLRRTVV